MNYKTSILNKSYFERGKQIQMMKIKDVKDIELIILIQ